MSWYSRVLSVTAAAIVVTGVAVATSAPAQARPAVPNVQGTQTEPTYSYADAIRESGWVQAPFDPDHDGQPDKIAVDLVRPPVTTVTTRAPAAITPPARVDQRRPRFQ